MIEGWAQDQSGRFHYFAQTGDSICGAMPRILDAKLEQRTELLLRDCCACYMLERKLKRPQHRVQGKGSTS